MPIVYSMKTCVSNVRLAVLPLAFAAAFPSFSQTRDMPQLTETVVTATRNLQLLSSALPHTTVISREDIVRSQATDLVTLLQREAGLQRTQAGGIGTATNVFMRGAASLQTLVLLDGVPLNKQDASGSVSLENLMLDQIERVEIVRGNVSAIYGSGAIGGVIQIFTRAGGGKPSASVSAELGPRAFRRLSGNVNARSGDTTISAGVSRITTKGFSAVDTAQYNAANSDADGYQNTTVSLAVAHQLQKGHTLGARVFKSNGDTDYDNPFGAPVDLQTSTTRLSQTTVFSDNTWNNWRSRLSLSEKSDKNRIYDNGLFGFNGGFITHASVLNWANTVALSDLWLVTAGLDLQRQRAETTVEAADETTYDRKRNTTAVFAGVEGKLGAGNLQFNLRRDKVGDIEETTGYVGYSHAITEQVKLIGSVSTAFNAPPLGYLFSPGFGNPLLRPEHARTKELGLQFEQPGNLLRATYFDTRVRDQLTFDNATFAFANLNRTRNKGLELSYKGSLRSTDLHASLTLQDPVNELSSEALIRRAKTLLLLGVSHPVGALRLGADLIYSGQRPDEFTNTVTFERIKTTLAPYAILDLSAAYRVSAEVQLKARLDNVTDKKYQTVYGYNQQPRSLFVGLTWTPL